MKESVLVTHIIKTLKKRGAYCEKIWGGGFQKAGIPDILASYKGYFIGIEVKVGNNKPSPLQVKKIELINQSGGIGIVVWDLKAVVDLLDALDLWVKLINDFKKTINFHDYLKRNIRGKYEIYIQ